MSRDIKRNREALGCCCKVVCPEPQVEYKTASVEVRIAGYAPYNDVDDKLYRTQNWDSTSNDALRVGIFREQTGSPGDVSGNIDPGDDTINQLHRQGGGGDVASTAFNVQFIHQLKIRAKASRTTNEKKHKINGVWNREIVRVQPETMITNENTRPTLSGNIDYEVEKYGEPRESRATESINVFSTMSMIVVSDAEAGYSSDRLSPAEVQWRWDIVGSKTFSNGLTISTYASPPPEYDQRVQFDWNDAVESDEVLHSDLFDYLENMSVAPSDYTGNSGAARITKQPGTGVATVSVPDTHQYRYREIRAVLAQLCFRVSSSFEGSFFEIEYEVFDEETSLSTGVTEWSGAGDSNDPSGESWLTDPIELPRPLRLTSNIHAVIKRYRCYHSQQWQIPT